ncbi:MAG: hypothetical protein K2Y22_14465 [Candidatus Obscuribacterales bacterium]|nr:hypothetical protein [Candidatus Obscuribacterales bacterium]
MINKQSQKEVSDFSISLKALNALRKTSVKESELEESGKRYTNDILFAPPASEEEEERNFIQFSDYFGE